MDRKKEYRSMMIRIGFALILNIVLLLSLTMISEFCFDSFDGPLFSSIADRTGITASRVAYSVTELSDAAIYLFSFMFPVAFFRMISGRRRVEGMRLAVRTPKTTPLLIVASVGLILGVAIVNNLLFSWLDLSGLFGSDPIDEPYKFVISFISTALVPGFCEEFLFRGCVLSNLLPYGRNVAVIGSAAAFALMHGNPVQYLYTFAAGIVLGLLYEQTGSIWPGTLVHVFNNYYSVITEQMSDNGASGLLLSLMDITLFLAAAACIVALVMLRKGKLMRAPTAENAPSVSVELNRNALLSGYFNPVMIIYIVISALQAAMVFLASWML